METRQLKVSASGVLIVGIGFSSNGERFESSSVTGDRSHHSRGWGHQRQVSPWVGILPEDHDQEAGNDRNESLTFGSAR